MKTPLDLWLRAQGPWPGQPEKAFASAPADAVPWWEEGAQSLQQSLQPFLDLFLTQVISSHSPDRLKESQNNLTFQGEKSKGRQESWKGIRTFRPNTHLSEVFSCLPSQQNVVYFLFMKWREESWTARKELKQTSCTSSLTAWAHFLSSSSFPTKAFGYPASSMLCAISAVIQQGVLHQYLRTKRNQTTFWWVGAKSI